MPKKIVINKLKTWLLTSLVMISIAIFMSINGVGMFNPVYYLTLFISGISIYFRYELYEKKNKRNK